ncbi:hypothetical protein TNCV_1689091 [Trichonephila clavipes]|nr:hypothetical protein TNCV_1689091 [Trichonephila clavipes]
MMDQSLQTKTLHSNGFQAKKTDLRTTSNKNFKDDAENRYLEELVQRASNQLFKTCMPNPAEEKKLDSGVKPAPPEICQKDLTVNKRRSFLKALFVKNILYLRVVDIENPYDYKLQVVAKHGNCMDLEDLQIMIMILFRQSREQNEASTEGESLGLSPVDSCLKTSIRFKGMIYKNKNVNVCILLS